MGCATRAYVRAKKPWCRDGPSPRLSLSCPRHRTRPNCGQCRPWGCSNSGNWRHAGRSAAVLLHNPKQPTTKPPSKHTLQHGTTSATAEVVRQHGSRLSRDSMRVDHPITTPLIQAVVRRRSVTAAGAVTATGAAAASDPRPGRPSHLDVAAVVHVFRATPGGRCTALGDPLPLAASPWLLLLLVLAHPGGRAGSCDGGGGGHSCHAWNVAARSYCYHRSGQL